MSVVIAPYAPGKPQSVSVSVGDTLIIPTCGMPLDLLITTAGTVTAVAVKRYPSLAADVATSFGVALTPSGIEDVNGYLLAAQSIVAGTKDLPLAAGQDGWSVAPTGATITVAWTLLRSKVDTSDFRP